MLQLPQKAPAAAPTPATATSEGSPAPAPPTSEGSPSPVLATSEGSPALAPTPATSKCSLAPPDLAPALAPDDPLHNPVISAPSNTDEKEVECQTFLFCH
jgi:hypothetical protein